MGYFSKSFWRLCLSTLLFFTSFNLIIPELSSYLESLGSKNKAWIISSFAFVALVCRPFSGILSDKIGRVPVMMIGAIIGCLASASYPFASFVSVFIAIRLFHGMSAGFKPTGTVAYVSDIVPDNRRGEAMGIIGLMNNIGFMIGVGLGSLVKIELGFQTLFFFSALFALASLLVILGMKETIPNKETFKPKFIKLAYQEILSKEVLKPSIVMLFGVIPFGSLLTLIPDYSEKIFHLNNKGLFFICMTFSTLTVRFFGGKLSDRVGRVPVIIIGTFFLLIGLILICATQNFSLFIFSAVIFGIATGFNSPSIFAWAIDLASTKARGRAMSTLFIFLELGIIIGSIFPAIIAGKNPNNIRSAFLLPLVTTFIMLCILVYYFSKREK